MSNASCERLSEGKAAMREAIEMMLDSLSDSMRRKPRVNKPRAVREPHTRRHPRRITFVAPGMFARATRFDRFAH
ncbi:hypothetical protein ACWPKO_29225 (plasmid) [Coraliomargarita sp. W4R53]